MEELLRSACANIDTDDRFLFFESKNLKQGVFEFYTAFQNIRNVDGPENINFCVVNEASVTMMFLIDLDGSLKPSTISTSGPSTLLASDGGQLSAFVNPGKCVNIAVGCYTYCADVCFRSMRYEVNAINAVNPTLKVCRRDNRSICTNFPGGRRGTEPLTFMAHVPVGFLYDAVFVDGNGVELTVPNVSQEVEPSLCPSGGVFGVTLYTSMPKA
jgi:hypothetical protein